MDTFFTTVVAGALGSHLATFMTYQQVIALGFIMLAIMFVASTFLPKTFFKGGVFIRG